MMANFKVDIILARIVAWIQQIGITHLLRLHVGVASYDILDNNSSTNQCGGESMTWCSTLVTRNTGPTVAVLARCGYSKALCAQEAVGEPVGDPPHFSRNVTKYCGDLSYDIIGTI